MAAAGEIEGSSQTRAGDMRAPSQSSHTGASSCRWVKSLWPSLLGMEPV